MCVLLASREPRSAIDPVGDMTLTSTREHLRTSEHAVAMGVLGVFVVACFAAEAAGLGKLLIIAVVSCHIFYIKRRFFYL